MVARKLVPDIEEKEPRYKAPALEKGLDILELLAQQGEPLTTSQMATALSRSVSELFRMVVTLEARGYIAQLEGSDGYALTSKMFALGIAQTPIKGLTEIALPVMQKLAEALGQCCYLSVESAEQVVVVARVDSPGALGFSIRVGYRRAVIGSATGIALMSGRSPERIARLLSDNKVVFGSEGLQEFAQGVQHVLQAGYIRLPNALVQGVNDLSAPIAGRDGSLAALTIPFLGSTHSLTTESQAIQQLVEGSKRISQLLALEG